MTKTELLQELYFIEHGGRRGDADHAARLANYEAFLAQQGMSQEEVIDLLLLTTTAALMHLPNASPEPLADQVKTLLLTLNNRAK
ncbi:MAG TPA: hypothetical protein VMA09_11030 [Candidatus Binataceae bacterium]|nr:hypothetical protein [Candidatus Binataceae bacterium]